MKWENKNSHHYATDDDRPPRDHYFSIDTFLFGALSRIGEAYNYSNCPTIYFDLKSGESLSVFDSPKTLALDGSAKVSSQLTSLAFSRHCHEINSKTATEYGDESDEHKRAQYTLDDLTWNAIRKNMNNGKARMQLDKFKEQPSLIMLINSNGDFAHHLLTSKRVALLDKPIEESATDSCRCAYCKFQISKLGKTPPAPDKPANISHLIEIIDYGDFEEIESARETIKPDDIAPLVAEYWARTDWHKKRTIVILMMDQQSEMLTPMMLDFLRAPEDIAGDENELAKAVAIGFVDDKYRNFTTYWNDRDHLKRDIDAVLKANGLEMDSWN